MRLTVLFMLYLTCASATAKDPLATRVEAAVPDGFSGQVVVATPSEVLYSGSFRLADQEAGTPVRNDMLFDMGSITKTFTATAILKLEADGKLALDQPLSTWFDGLDGQKADITVHQMLTHSAGLPEYSGEDEEPRTAASFDSWLAEAELDFAPGDHYAYSNTGYSALARIVEKVSGQGFEPFVHQQVLAPLGITGIGYTMLPENAVEAVGYFGGESGGIPSSRGWLDDGPGWNLRGNGGMLASAESLMAFLQALANGRTLPQAQAEAQIAKQIDEGEGSGWYGYGIGINERDYGTTISHNGGNGAFFAMIAWYPDDKLLISLTNNAFDIEQVQVLLPALRSAVGVGAAQEGKTAP